MELYIHYPFCAKKCYYCDFLSAPASKESRALYMDALKQELKCMAGIYRGKQLNTIFIGGGTPSLMAPKVLESLMDEVRKGFCLSDNCEITIEANPGTLNRDFVRAMKVSGINRLSLGLQSAADDELEYLGRIHKFKDFCDSFYMAREAGIENINVDLMSALPGQTLKSWEQTLKQVADRGPEHISAYSLIIEEGTPFYELYGENTRKNSFGARDGLGVPGRAVLPLPDEDTERRMYMETRTILADYGYERYEISNYARPGFECRHNTGYWRREEYLGVGLGASGFMDGKRFDNPRDFKTYLSYWSNGEQIREAFPGCYENIQVLDREEAMAEFMFLGLRLSAGVCDCDFRHSFGESFMDVYGDIIDRHCREGLLHYIEETKQLYLTGRGVDISNYVLCDFL